MEHFVKILAIVAVAMLLLSVRLLVGKRRFVNFHVDGSPAMRRRGIRCVKAQDAEQRAKRKPIAEHTRASSRKNLDYD